MDDTLSMEVTEQAKTVAEALRTAQRLVHTYFGQTGFHDDAAAVEAADPRGRQFTVAARIAMIHSEVSEAMAEVRKPEISLDRGPRPVDDPLSFEFADILIRTLEAAEDLGIDLGAALVAKAAASGDRGHRHGGLRL